ncbi:MAG: hypothetical protein AAF799_13350 [Myxococcota bacterium]
MANHRAQGLGCQTCAEGPCACDEGSCGACQQFATVNEFTTARSIEGWTLTGDWALRTFAPQSQVEPRTIFSGQVLGTDGNRSDPAPGEEAETSYARTPEVPLPETVVFWSWHVDEGAGDHDAKSVRVSTDGGISWVTLADCNLDPGLPFCAYVNTADPAAWAQVELAVPEPLQGQLGIIEFGYDTVDECCTFEKGWYIDSLNVGTECACVADSDCMRYGSACGSGQCLPTGECGLLPSPLDWPCGDPTTNECNGADTCDGQGYCRDHLEPTGLVTCDDCPSGGPCSVCVEGECPDCGSVGFDPGFDNPMTVADWTISPLFGSPDWGLFDEAPRNANPGSEPVPFPNAPVFGVDGNRDPPYPGYEMEHSRVVTGEGIIAAALTFDSWHVDEGGANHDTKRVELSVDDGATWHELANCEGAAGSQLFCTPVGDGRAGDDWDAISLDTSAWEGQTGRLRFSYDTQDGCCSFERGWFIDNLDGFTQVCEDDPFP